MSNKKTHEFRQATEPEIPQFTSLMKYAFTEQDAEDHEDKMLPEWTLCAFEGEQMVASSAVFPFKMRFNGEGMLAAGVTGVAVNPGYRRQGLVRELMTRTLVQEHEKGVPVAILWASMGAIYQRFGYGLASTHVRYSFDPRFAGFQLSNSVHGGTRLYEKSEGLPIIKNIYRQYCMDRNLLIHRAERTWETMLPDKGKQKQYIAIFSDDDGQPTAYSLYQTKWMNGQNTGPDQKLTVSDFCWLDMNAYQGMWEFLCAHDLVGTIDWHAVPEDDPAPGLLLEPRTLQRRTMDGIWLRVIDVESCLASRKYSQPGEVILKITEDELCPWNTGVYEISSSGEACEVRRTDQNSNIDIELSTQALASLASGHSKASWLGRIGRLNATRPERLPDIDSFFETQYRPTCANDF
jgi:predicted acetyltransferase